jgi:aspartyl-tRNA(Asn)/glutamyl-tRNA(Gln) amidotransferase subunit C
MNINHKEIMQCADLSCLKFTDDELQKLQVNMSEIINWVNDIKEVKTENFDSADDISVTNIIGRDDKSIEILDPKFILSNSSSAEENMFCVPKVVNKNE